MPTRNSFVKSPSRRRQRIRTWNTQSPHNNNDYNSETGQGKKEKRRKSFQSWKDYLYTIDCSSEYNFDADEDSFADPTTPTTPLSPADLRESLDMGSIEAAMKKNENFLLDMENELKKDVTDFEELDSVGCAINNVDGGACGNIGRGVGGGRHHFTDVEVSNIQNNKGDNDNRGARTSPIPIKDKTFPSEVPYCKSDGSWSRRRPSDPDVNSSLLTIDTQFDSGRRGKIKSCNAEIIADKDFLGGELAFLGETSSGPSTPIVRSDSNEGCEVDSTHAEWENRKKIERRRRRSFDSSRGHHYLLSNKEVQGEINREISNSGDSLVLQKKLMKRFQRKSMDKNHGGCRSPSYGVKKSFKSSLTTIVASPMGSEPNSPFSAKARNLPVSG